MDSSSAPGARPVTEPGAYAIVRSEPPRLFLAENASVMSRLIALRVVAAEDPGRVAPATIEAMRDALLEERWADAVLLWMTATDTDIDIFPEYVPVWTDAELDEDLTSMEIRMARIFADAPDGSAGAPGNIVQFPPTG